MNAPPPPDFDDVPPTGVLQRVEARLTSIEHLEWQRVGATKSTNRYLLVFGGLGTALALAFLVMTWKANGEDARRDAEIAHLSTAVVNERALELRIVRVDAAQKALTVRLDRQSRQLDELLLRLPQSRGGHDGR